MIDRHRRKDLNDDRLNIWQFQFFFLKKQFGFFIVMTSVL